MKSTSPARLSQVLAALLAAVLLAGCSGSDPDSRAEDPGAPDELSEYDGVPCPETLPASSDDHGLGTSEPAPGSPDLGGADRAWVCGYAPEEAGTAPDGQGVTFGWPAMTETAELDPDQVATVMEHLDQLTPASAEQMCTMDLGPRWMLVLAHDRDLTGVVVDDFGCRNARITDDPSRTPPGEATAPGTVPGMLAAPPELLVELRAALPD